MKEMFKSIYTKVINYILESFGFPGINDYIQLNSSEVRKNLQKKMYYLNCRRILSIMPLMLIINIFTIVYYDTTNQHPEITWLLNIYVGFLVIFALFLASLMYKYRDLKYKPFVCRVIYLFFWIIYMSFLRSCATYFNESHLTGVWSVCMASFLALVPLVNNIETIGEIILVAAFVFVSDTHGTSTADHVILALIIIIAITQKLNYLIIIMRDYIKEYAFYDPLTHLLNRRGASSQFEDCLHKYKTRYPEANQIQYGIIMLDIDFFKKYNDTFGHDEGDRCLEKVATAIKHAVVGRTELTIRHGGEEFVVILIGASEKESVIYAEKIRQSVINLELPAPDTSISEYVTVSIGIDVVDCVPDHDYSTVLAGADKALYHSKENGRNQITTYSAISQNSK
ncbi:MAG: GGDEF domain-containing protein [Lachnospiraceae bacterium]|nr:GGDEF domain-containing protein [Lachnospiraceae bacterium]